MDLLDRARVWLEQDPDPVTRAELQRLIDLDDVVELADRFDGRLQFGTAGLRGALGAGPRRMNRVVVAQAAAGLAAYLLDHVAGGPAVVIGYDARHNSAVFARDTAEIMTGAGVRAHLLPGPLPTPVLAFAIRHLGCDAGVMVTASHNPPQDNGYKVYLGDSSQIVPPADGLIAAAIERVGPVDRLPRDDTYTVLAADVADAYASAAADLLADGPRDVVAVYTPLHGVGRDTFVDVVSAAGFAPLHVVAEQAEPDPDFPTVAFPNPEEPGAMDLALRLAGEVDADLVVAHDPDADRCAVGVRDPSGSGHRMLTGDQVGALLADHLLRRGAAGTYAASIVSSDLLGRQAAAHGRPWQQTLTGFKWIGKIDDLAFGFEEALGYCVAPHIARDKDGVTAGLVVLELAAELRRDGLTLLDRLDEIHREHGVHHTGQLSVRVEDLAIITTAMTVLRSTPPDRLGGMPVSSVDDLAAGYRGLPPTDGIRLGLAAGEGLAGARVICRPSGTEPKLKCYIEVVAPVTTTVEAARAAAETALVSVSDDLAAALGI
ncbi:phosphoglucomutase/phosphomannomutase, alpha/beta/alpha domain II [Aeromicrobium marinum DSM 15272]|uniref:Phosphoglucomutase/phosphomannomutase, alpha/beta/alpha domain II n=1 Tax=Aeromicrobium marinum DSM 15272 TaxID=585531 RepID=E2SBP5_9ACTN|nr:phospho-sugar mutase [Aeromicrobium marinum]EFQ83791.1 phosphoglucomutase/phosphomannomutase, alpha/beta/alpha domain II [Aeromicrobium marinum DSM 15272]